VIDHQSLAAGERLSDHASPSEVRDFWLDRAHASLNAARAAQGKPPVLRAARAAAAGLVPVTITAPKQVLVVSDADLADPAAVLVDVRTVARWRAAQAAFSAAQVEMAKLVLGKP